MKKIVFTICAFFIYSGSTFAGILADTDRSTYLPSDSSTTDQADKLNGQTGQAVNPYGTDRLDNAIKNGGPNVTGMPWTDPPPCCTKTGR